MKLTERTKQIHLKTLAKIEDKHNKLTAEMEKLEKKLKRFVKFDFSIGWMAGDGFMILNNDTDDVAPLDKCIKIIHETGALTEEQHAKASI